MKINESLRLVQNSKDYLIISETDEVWYNKLYTLSTKILYVANILPVLLLNRMIRGVCKSPEAELVTNEKSFWDSVLDEKINVYRRE